MENLNTVDGFKHYFTNIVYTAHALDKKLTVQSLYRQLQNTIDIALEKGHPDITTKAYIKESESDLRNLIHHFSDINPDFMEKEYALEQLNRFFDLVSGAFRAIQKKSPAPEIIVHDDKVHDRWEEEDSKKVRRYHLALEQIQALAAEHGEEKIYNLAVSALQKGN